VSDEPAILNGVSGVDGEYLVPPARPEDLAALASGTRDDPALVSWLKKMWESVSQPHLGLPMDVEPSDVTQAGWGVVFAQGTPPEVRAAVEKLIEHRKQSIDERLVRVLDHSTGDTWQGWLARHKTAPGTVDPTKVPYYLLLVGGPDAIPFEFQYLLDVEYAVGRLSFGEPASYHAYVDSVIAYETASEVPHERSVLYFAPRRDRATQLSADHLVGGLIGTGPADGGEAPEQGIAEKMGYRSDTLIGEEATKPALVDVLAGASSSSRPALLFTASHGVAFPPGHEEQERSNGALLCQEWPGPGSVDPAHYLTAAEMPENAAIHGMMTFHFACYSAGTPEFDQYFFAPGKEQRRIAQRSFTAALPSRLLSEPSGGALCAIGHVERAFGFSFIPRGGNVLIQPFRNAVGHLLAGRPVGFAMRDFSEKYAALSTSLASTLYRSDLGAEVPNYELASEWVERNDAQNYVVLGDPAVRLRAPASEGT
jgi:hypothetical protein